MDAPRSPTRQRLFASGRDDQVPCREKKSYPDEGKFSSLEELAGKQFPGPIQWAFISG